MQGTLLLERSRFVHHFVLEVEDVGMLGAGLDCVLLEFAVEVEGESGRKSVKSGGEGGRGGTNVVVVESVVGPVVAED